jgi:phosphoribosylformimino-5-aminoimidazole carboxamide ribotide isomerase
MLIYPAIDLVGGQAVRLVKGDYAQLTVYSPDPVAVARDFAACGATHMHMVDLEGARDGGTPNFAMIAAVKREAGLFCEVGGGVRDFDTIGRYLSAGIDRVILGTAATRDGFAEKAAAEFGEHIAVGVDIRDGFVAVKGWLEKTALEAFDFCRRMQDAGIRTLICTDISRDGMMAGTNVELYKKLSSQLELNVIASGGVSSLDEVKRLRSLGMHGAIIGKAYYTGTIDLREAIETAR